MPDAIFAHHRLAPLYDAFDGPRDDLTPYLALADDLDARSIVDIGCGTGALAILLAESGRGVVAVDPASASLEVAKSKAGAHRITWLHGDATTLPPAAADLALMTGNVAQVFLTDEAWSQTLHSIHSALRPEGHLVFETRRPDRRAWEDWAAAAPITIDIPGIGRVEERLELIAVELPYVSFRHTYTFRSDGTAITSDSTLRFRPRGELESTLAAHGFTVRDVRQAPDRPEREFVFIAKRGN
ncbi:class I SAM-dependent methyltransferase [Nocardia sp. NPDC051030]|uniref:class I SAM-dependent methyltransferase n=1 Tax=Nocardia sp. NPDC051030 TaxID=3155162 RepID=UPI0034346BB3